MEELLFAVPLSQSQRHRTHVLPVEGFPAHRNTLRPKRDQFPRCRLHRRDRQLLVMSLGPNRFQRLSPRIE